MNAYHTAKVCRTSIRNSKDWSNLLLWKALYSQIVISLHNVSASVCFHISGEACLVILRQPFPEKKQQKNNTNKSRPLLCNIFCVTRNWDKFNSCIPYGTGCSHQRDQSSPLGCIGLTDVAGESQMSDHLCLISSLCHSSSKKQTNKAFVPCTQRPLVASLKQVATK